MAKLAVAVLRGQPVPSSVGAGAGCRQQSLALGWELGLSPEAGAVGWAAPEWQKFTPQK